MCRVCRLEHCDDKFKCGEEREGRLKMGKEDKYILTVSRGGIRRWMIPSVTVVLLWTCFVQLMGLDGTWGPRLLMGWPSCFSTPDMFSDHKFSSVPTGVLPPKSELKPSELCVNCLLNIFSDWSTYGPFSN
ncbi:hypothetical protein U1Q18_012208 [Sarracenia purpurea var. burkii]